MNAMLLILALTAPPVNTPSYTEHKYEAPEYKVSKTHEQIIRKYLIKLGKEKEDCYLDSYRIVKYNGQYYTIALGTNLHGKWQPIIKLHPNGKGRPPQIWKRNVFVKVWVVQPNDGKLDRPRK